MHFSIVECRAVREKPSLTVRLKNINNGHCNQVTWLERVSGDTVHPSPYNAMSGSYAVSSTGDPHYGQPRWVNQVKVIAAGHQR
jgi:hypothetical protein